MAIKLAGGSTPYTLKEDRESETPTLFHIRDLTAIERGQLDDGFAALPPLPTADEKEITPAVLGSIRRAMDSAYRRACEIGIESVTGVLDAAGNVVDIPAKEVIAQLRNPDHIRELGQAVLEQNRLGEEERGNS